MTTKEVLQRQIDHWVDMVKSLEERMTHEEYGEVEYTKLLRCRDEYTGRIYAARFFDEKIGFGFDTKL